MKRNLIYIAIASILISTPAQALDWGLGHIITTNIKNIFSRSAEEKTMSKAEYYQAKETETLSKFFENAKLSGYVTKTGEIDYTRINKNERMVAKLNSIMNNIEPAAGSSNNSMIFQLKPEKFEPIGTLRPIKY